MTVFFWFFSGPKGFEEGMVVRISLYHTKLWYAFGFLSCLADMWVMFAKADYMIQPPLGISISHSKVFLSR